jgi:hypothetical protein
MSIIGMSEEEKKKISDQHKLAIKSDLDKKTDLKNGLKKPEKKEEDKKTSN